MVKRLQGFSLIELMITISIMMLLLMFGVPLTTGWVNGSYVNQSSNTLQQAFSMLKARALQNSAGASGTEVAATLVTTGSQICLYKGKASSLTCNSGYLWQATTSAPISLNGAMPQCIALDNSASAVSTSISSTNCGTGLTYSISKGSENATGVLN